MVFTYLLPINLLTVTWDGWMSVLRAIKPSQYRQWCKAHSSPHYTFNYVAAGAWWRKVHILIGEPIA
jgi:hypothetical protein